MNEEEKELIIKKYPLKTLYFYLTGDCNLACRHCWVAPRFQQTPVSQCSLDYDLFTNIIGEAKQLGLSTVKLTGGEPLIHPRIFDIISFIREEEISVSIESNGTALTPKLANEIVKGKHPFLSISLDGSSANIHEWVRGVPGCFEQAVRGIRLAVDAGIKPQIIMTLMQTNRNEIEPVIELAEDLGAGSVKVNILQPTARGRSMHDQGENINIEELISLGSKIEREIAGKASIPVIFGHPHAFQPLSRILRPNCHCGTCDIHHILGVLHNGFYALCGIGMTVPAMVFGSASHDPLFEVWSGNVTLQQIREGIPDSLQGICQECVMKQLCLGSCIAQNYDSSGNIFAPYWYCDEAHKKGLFPTSRLRMITTERNFCQK